MLRLVKWTVILSLLTVGGTAAYFKISPVISPPEGMKVEVRNNKCKLLSKEGRPLMEMEADGTTFTVKNNGTKFGTHVHGSKVKIIDEDKVTILCEIDYNGHVMCVTNVHAVKIVEVDVNLKMDKDTGTVVGIKIPKL